MYIYIRIHTELSDEDSHLICCNDADKILHNHKERFVPRITDLRHVYESFLAPRELQPPLPKLGCSLRRLGRT